MPVYVDDYYQWGGGQLGRMKMSHMMADTSEELLEMASRLGLDHGWLQEAGTYKEHFDICKKNRVKAVLMGAVLMNVREMVEYRRGKQMMAFATGSDMVGIGK